MQKMPRKNVFLVLSSKKRKLEKMDFCRIARHYLCLEGRKNGIFVHMSGREKNGIFVHTIFLGQNCLGPKQQKPGKIVKHVVSTETA